MTSEHRLRLACHGWVHEHAGSVASAGHVVLEELLRRDIQVDLFAHRDHVPPPPALGARRLPVLRLRAEPAPGPRRPDPRVRPAAIACRVLPPASRRYWRRTFEPALEAEHARAPYDAVLTLGTSRDSVRSAQHHLAPVALPHRARGDQAPAETDRLRERTAVLCPRPGELPVQVVGGSDMR